MTVRTANALQAGVRTDYCIWKLCMQRKRGFQLAANERKEFLVSVSA